MKNYTFIGISEKQSIELSEDLNKLLANYQVYYQNLRGFHWNIKGDQFFELHEKFEEYYNDAQLKIDEIAERILTLGGRPLHTFTAYLQASSIPEVKDADDAKTCVSAVLDNLKTLLELEREIMDKAGDLADEGTSALMSDYIREQEKTTWMLAAYLS